MAVNSSLLRDIKAELENTINPDLKTGKEAGDRFKFYIFSIVVKAARNEGALVYYKDVDKNNPETLVFRRRAGQLYDSTQAYTHAVIEFPNKPPLEIHMGVKVHGRLRVLYDCDICVLYKIEADACRNNRREPRTSRILLAVDCQHYASELKLEFAQAFLSLASELRVAGECYFVSNSESEVAAKLLASRKRKWECDIVPGKANNVNRLMYGFQTIFKDFKAKS